ncbi:mechanosensitive ion channel [Streptomyces sp. AC563]|uniref:mechanosensitive ion channel family protein n=1 Tax=Streptomyces buecherae TaxID=2763006 RepID=UPI00164EB572|nr:mechanosensitive ion channel domain-containing protein [Streptomyces buecherae]MBC3991791.1 mechanosensitive ion channel [Streptomyces buecherae]
MEDVLRPLIVIGGSVALTVVVGWLADRLLSRTDQRHPETPLWGLLRRCRFPFQVALCTSVIHGSYRETHLLSDENHWEAVGLVLTLVSIVMVGWLIVRVSAAVIESSYARYATGRRDPARARRVRTQLTLIQRVVTAVVGVVAAAVMLLQFPAMQAFGTSMLASAGVLGIVAGIAAQSTLGNLFAGLQIAFGDTVRIGDTVVVEGEWGTVHEITLTYLVVRTWDERMITMPVSYFTSKPFENWSRGGAQMTGTVFFQLDHATPVAQMRERLREILDECPAWDGRAWNLVVTDSTPTTMEVRALATARNADDLWTLRCEVREKLLIWLRDEHPYALPRVLTAPAPGQDPAQLLAQGPSPEPAEVAPRP